MPINDETVHQLLQDVQRLLQDVAACKVHAEESARNTDRIDKQLVRMNGKFAEHEHEDDMRFARVDKRLGGLEGTASLARGSIKALIWVVGVLLAVLAIVGHWIL